MKKMILFVFCLICSMAVFGCGAKQEKEVVLLENASPENSAMELFYFDGENTTRRYLYDRSETEKIVSEINDLKTVAMDSKCLSEMTVPAYGIEIGDKDGFEIWLTYSNGLWLLKDGSVYKADYDFKKMLKRYEDLKSDSQPGGISMPNAAYLGETDIRYYSKSEELNDTEDGITLSVLSFHKNRVTVKLENNSSREFMYGEECLLQKKIDDEWYYLPVKLSNYGVAAVGYSLEEHENKEQVCDLTPYGELKPGSYRIVKSVWGMVADKKLRMAAEFEVKK